MRTACIAGSLALLAACADIPSNLQPGGNAQWVQSPAERWLVVGEEIVVDSVLRIGFSRVAGDSRCPSSVVCVWAGDAEVELAIAFGSGPSQPFSLHTTLQPRAIDVWGHRLTLVNLSPYPDVPGPIPPDAYVLRLRVERQVR